MSLYSHLLVHQHHGLVRVGYGYDPAMKESFLMVEKVIAENQEREEFEYDEAILFSISLNNTIKPMPTGKLTYSVQELEQVCKEYGAKVEHLQAILAGIPF